MRNFLFIGSLFFLSFSLVGCDYFFTNKIHRVLSENWMIKDDDVLKKIRKEIVEPCLSRMGVSDCLINAGFNSCDEFSGRIFCRHESVVEITHSKYAQVRGGKEDLHISIELDVRLDSNEIENLLINRNGSSLIFR